MSNKIDNFEDIDTSHVTEEMMAEFYAAERKASDDFWAAERNMQRLDALRSTNKGNPDYTAVYKYALADFRKAKKVAESFGLFL